MDFWCCLISSFTDRFLMLFSFFLLPLHPLWSSPLCKSIRFSPCLLGFFNFCLQHFHLILLSFSFYSLWSRLLVDLGLFPPFFFKIKPPERTAPAANIVEINHSLRPIETSTLQRSIGESTCWRTLEQDLHVHACVGISTWLKQGQMKILEW